MLRLLVWNASDSVFLLCALWLVFVGVVSGSFVCGRFVSVCIVDMVLCVVVYVLLWFGLVGEFGCCGGAALLWWF